MATSSPMVPTPTVPKGMSQEEAMYRGVALSQLNILREQMKLGGLNTGNRSVRLDNGVVVECSICYNKEDIFVYIPLPISKNTNIISLPSNLIIIINGINNTQYTKAVAFMSNVLSPAYSLNYECYAKAGVSAIDAGQITATGTVSDVARTASIGTTADNRQARAQYWAGEDYIVEYAMSHGRYGRSDNRIDSIQIIDPQRNKIISVDASAAFAVSAAAVNVKDTTGRMHLVVVSASVPEWNGGPVYVSYSVDEGAWLVCPQDILLYAYYTVPPHFSQDAKKCSGLMLTDPNGGWSATGLYTFSIRYTATSSGVEVECLVNKERPYYLDGFTPDDLNHVFPSWTPYPRSYHAVAKWCYEADYIGNDLVIAEYTRDVYAVDDSTDYWGSSYRDVYTSAITKNGEIIISQVMSDVTVTTENNNGETLRTESTATFVATVFDMRSPDIFFMPFVSTTYTTEAVVFLDPLDYVVEQKVVNTTTKKLLGDYSIPIDITHISDIPSLRELTNTNSSTRVTRTTSGILVSQNYVPLGNPNMEFETWEPFVLRGMPYFNYPTLPNYKESALPHYVTCSALDAVLTKNNFLLVLPASKLLIQDSPIIVASRTYDIDEYGNSIVYNYSNIDIFANHNELVKDGKLSQHLPYEIRSIGFEGQNRLQ